ARTQLRENLAEPLLEIPTLNLFGRLRVDLVEGGVALVELVELVGPGWEENPFTKHLNLRTVLHRVARRRVAGVLDVDVLEQVLDRVAGGGLDGALVDRPRHDEVGPHDQAGRRRVRRTDPARGAQSDRPRIG